MPKVRLKGFGLALAILVAGMVPAGMVMFAKGETVQAKPVKRDDPLPFAKGRTFSDLDSYLAHLKSLGPVDIPYYERLPDGRYELVAPFIRKPGMKRIFTRTELLERYGFSH